MHRLASPIEVVRVLLAPGLLGAVMFAGGCAPYSDPSLRVTDVIAKDETDAGLALAFTLDAENHNEVPLPLREAEYELELADGGGRRRVFRGIRSPEATLNPNGEQRIVLPAVIALREGETGEVRSMARPVGVHDYRFWVRLTYVTPGALAETLFDTGVRRPTVTYSQTGQIDFGEGPGAGARLVTGTSDQ